MSPYDFPGLVSHLIAFQLVLWGVVAAALSGLRALLVRGQAGRGHLARGILAGSGLVVAAGILLGALAELLDSPRALDRFGAPVIALAAVVGGALLARRVTRRGAAASPGGEGSPGGEV